MMHQERINCKSATKTISSFECTSLSSLLFIESSQHIDQAQISHFLLKTISLCSWLQWVTTMQYNCKLCSTFNSDGQKWIANEPGNWPAVPRWHRPLLPRRRCSYRPTCVHKRPLRSALLRGSAPDRRSHRDISAQSRPAIDWLIHWLISLLLTSNMGIKGGYTDRNKHTYYKRNCAITHRRFLSKPYSSVVLDCSCLPFEFGKRTALVTFFRSLKYSFMIFVCMHASIQGESVQWIM